MKNKAVVIDASYILDVLFPDEKIKELPKVKLVAPTLLQYEIVNAIKMAVVRKRIGQNVGRELIKEWQNWRIDYQEVDLTAVMNLALSNDLSVYDASYLWLAKEKKAKLLTWDKKLTRLADEV